MSILNYKVLGLVNIEEAKFKILAFYVEGKTKLGTQRNTAKLPK